MPRIDISINTDNAAFEDAYTPGAEVARILRKLADLAEPEGDVCALDSETLRDANGNTVGLVTVTE